MALTDSIIFNIAAALVVGLLIGVDRERRSLRDGARGTAGIRTYAITSLAGAASILVGGVPVLMITTACVMVLTSVGYWRTRRDGLGLTSEVTLLVTVLLGGLAMSKPHVAGSIAVIVTVLLASRSSLHRLTTDIITEQELHHALLFAVATVIIFPLIPNEQIGPGGSFNGRLIWLVVILVMGISAVGHIVMRLIGPRWGLPITGFASGFVSSTATIGAMGEQANKDPDLLRAAAAGAVLSTVATIIELALVLGVTDTPSLRALSMPLVFAGLMAALYATFFLRSASHSNHLSNKSPGAPFSLKSAILFATTLAVIMIVAAVLREQYGHSGTVLAAFLGGFADTHAVAFSVASLSAAGKLSSNEVVLPILAGFSANTGSKIAIAVASGNAGFMVRVVPGLLLVALAGWGGTLIHAP